MSADCILHFDSQAYQSIWIYCNSWSAVLNSSDCEVTVKVQRKIEIKVIEIESTCVTYLKVWCMFDVLMNIREEKRQETVPWEAATTENTLKTLTSIQPSTTSMVSSLNVFQVEVSIYCVFIFKYFVIRVLIDVVDFISHYGMLLSDSVNGNYLTIFSWHRF